jgi:hypothetical protein
MRWVVGPHTKCDLVGYSGANMTGARYVVRIFPTGSQKGTFRTHELKSIVVIAPPGTRVILAAREGDDWEGGPWRCVRVIAGQMFKNEQGNEGVRVPDLDWEDPPDAKRTSESRSYTFVDRVGDGATWTFGRGGGLKDEVRQIRVSREP